MITPALTRSGAIDGDAASFSGRLRRYREQRGLTQEELAEAAGLTARGVGALERGERRSPYPHTVRSLAAALGLSPGEQQALLRSTRRGDAGAKPVAAAASFLPAHPTPLLGRERDLALIARLLDQSEVRILTLTGPGGVGKTRLAFQAAVEAGRHFDGVVVVQLASLASSDQVPAAIGTALGLQDMGDREVTEAIVATLHNERTLLLLDNFEHLEPAAPLIAELVARCGRLKVLVSSRAPLGSRYEQQFPVSPLAIPTQEIDDPDDLLAYPSVQLFIERARAIDPSLDPLAMDLPAVAEICRGLDGLPLAIELAAARTRVLSPRAMVSRLARHLDLLTGGPCDLPDRQRTLRSAIAWSHDLLAPGEQVAFRRLAVFVGGFTIEAAEAILAGHDPSAAGGRGPASVTVVDHIEALARQSLVVTDRDADDGRRFRLLATVREFAQEQLDASGEAAEIHRQHAAWCLRLAEEGDQALLGAEQQHWQARLEREHANLRAALAWLRSQSEVETALRLGMSLARFWWLQGHYGQGRSELETLLALPGAASLGPWWAGAMTGLGMILYKQGDFTRATEVHQAAIAAWRALDIPAGLMMGLWGFGFMLKNIDPGAAEPLFAESYALAVAHEDEWMIGASRWGLAASALHLGRAHQAAEMLSQTLALVRRLGNPLALAAILQSSGQVERELGNPARATELIEESLILYRDQSIPCGVLGCLEDLATIEHDHGRTDRATRLLGAAEAQRETLGQHRPPVEDAAFVHTIGSIRDTLDESQFAGCWAEGWALRPPEAVTYALADILPQLPAPEPVLPPAPMASARS